MSHRSKLLKGTLILTATGLATRVMGFFYRIFMSHAFGEEGVGIYQLVFPIYALGFSLTCAGIELILSRLVAKNMALGKKKEARELLYSGLLITVIFSCIVTLFLQNYAGTIASSILHDARCTELLLILSYAFPFAAIHSCVCGYYFGQKETGLPARSQLIEQAVRVGSVMLIYFAGSRQGITFGVSLAVAGLIAGELASSLYCLKILSRQKEFLASRPSLLLICRQIPKLLIPSLPLTGNRVLLGILQSAEALSIPLKLQASGLSGQEALSVYGVLTGMALPCILFPSAISNSISTMLLPEVAEIQALNNKKAFRSLIQKTTCSCIAMGSLCCLFLLFTGRWIGTWIFHSSLAGELIQTLSFPLYQQHADQHDQWHREDDSYISHQFLQPFDPDCKYLLSDPGIRDSGISLGPAGQPAKRLLSVPFISLPLWSLLRQKSDHFSVCTNICIRTGLT